LTSFGKNYRHSRILLSGIYVLKNNGFPIREFGNDEVINMSELMEQLTVAFIMNLVKYQN